MKKGSLKFIKAIPKMIKLLKRSEAVLTGSGAECDEWDYIDRENVKKDIKKLLKQLV